jgi:hypothetical protein
MTYEIIFLVGFGVGFLAACLGAVAIKYFKKR